MDPDKQPKKTDDLITKRQRAYKPQSEKGKERMKKLFFQSVEQSIVSQLNECLVKKQDPNILNKHGEGALHIAAEKGDIAICSILMSVAFINLNITDTRGTTPLMLSVIYEHRHFARALLRNGANPNLRDCHENLALHFAVTKCNIGLVYDLVWFGSQVKNTNNAFEQTALSLAVIEYPNADIAKFLLRKGARQENKDFTIALEAALNCNTEKRLEVFETLVTFGDIDLNMRNRITGMTCLHIAAMTGYLPLAQFLIRNGANAVIKDIMNRTARDIAEEYRNVSVRDFLKFSRQKKSVGFAQTKT